MTGRTAMAMQDQQKGRSEQFLANLVSAQKCMQLYPASSPMIGTAMAKLASGLDNLFQTSPDPVVLGVIRDEFVEGRTVVGSAQASIKRFAASLYRAQVKLLTVSPGVTAEELHGFVTLVSGRPEEILAAGGLSAQMAALGLTHISIEEAAELQVVDREGKPDQWDLLDYLMNKGDAGGGAISGGGAGPRGAAADSVDASELEGVFRSLAGGAPELADCFHNTFSDPARIAETLDCLAGVRQLPGGEDCADSPEVLDRAFNHISDILATLPESVQEGYAKNIGAALDETSAEVKRLFMERILPAQMGQFSAADRIVSAFGDETVSEILTGHVMFNEGTSRTLENFMDGIVGDPQRSAMIRETVAANLAGSDGQRFGEITALLTDREASSPSQDGYGKSASVESRDHTEDVANELLERITPERIQTEQMIRDVSEDCTANASPYATDVALALQSRSEFGVFAESTAQLVSKSLKESFAQKRFDLMVHVLEQARNHENVIPGLQELSLDRFASDEQIDGIVDALRRLDPVSSEHASLVDVLRLMDERAVTHLFDRLAGDPDRPSRMFLLQLLVVLGKTVAGFMRHNIDRPEWFVVRNVVYVLGKVDPEPSVDALLQVLDHPEPRVRLELVQTLGTIGGDKVENAMLSLLADSDQSVAEVAAGFLRRLDGQRVLPAFRTMLIADRRSLHARPYVANRILRVFAETGVENDLKLLTDFRPSLLHFYSRASREVGRDCKMAMRRIRERMEKGEAG